MSAAQGPLVDPDTVPDWLRALVEGTTDLDFSAFPRRAMPGVTEREAAVLVLFGDGTDTTGGPDVLLLRRAETLGSHPGQVAFPGGGAEPGDGGPVGTALREAVEEVGLDPAGVRPLALLPRLTVPVSGFRVTPVLAHWTQPCAVRAVDPGETAAVARVPISMLVDPRNRLMVRHRSGFSSPGYLAPGMLIWGFTAGVLTVLLGLAGWDRPWDDTIEYDLDAAWDLALRREPPADGSLPAADTDVDAEVQR